MQDIANGKVELNLVTVYRNFHSIGSQRIAFLSMRSAVVLNTESVSAALLGNKLLYLGEKAGSFPEVKDNERIRKTDERKWQNKDSSARSATA